MYRRDEKHPWETIMEKIIRLHRKIAPELIATFEERYNILRHIYHAQPVGRRSLSATLDTGERVVRAQVDFLKNAGLVDFSPLGMTITESGQAILAELAEYIRQLHGLTVLEQEIAQALAVEKVVIIPGDSEISSMVAKELGRAAAAVLSQHLGPFLTIAVSGGSTMAHVAEALTVSAPQTLVVPARGGLGERVEYQANTVAAVMANNLGGKYRLLHIPDGLSEDALETVLTGDAPMRAVVDRIKRADILIYSIGQAGRMAERRGMQEEIRRQVLKRGAVGEALGHYCTLDGKIVHVTSSLGLKLNDLAEIGMVTAVAGGAAKAAAIVAVAHAGSQDVLVTDEAAARAIQMIIHPVPT